MKRFTTTFLVLTLLLLCRILVSAEEHVHLWSLWDYYKTTNEYHYGQRYCLECGNVETIKEEHAFMPNPSGYSYGDEDICYSEYRCKTCGEDIKIPGVHNWTIKTTPWTNFTDKLHQRTVDKRCSRCKRTEIKQETQKHNLGFHNTKYKGKSAIYWGCDICDYAYEKIVCYKSGSSTKKVDRKHYYTYDIPLPHTDKIKSIKVSSGKKRLKVKKMSATMIKVTPKKKGKAKLKVTSRAGIVRNFTFKIK